MTTPRTLLSPAKLQLAPPDPEAGYRAVLARQPKHFAALHGLGNALAQQRRYDEAARQLRAAIEVQPLHAQVHADLARVLRSLGRNDEATQHFERAVELEPASANLRLLALLHRGTQLDEQGRMDEAMACFEQAVVDHPDSADAWAALGFVQAHLKGPELAEQSLRRALQIDPARNDVIERFGEVLQDQRNYEDAAIVFERLLKLEPARPLTPGRLLHCKMLMADWTSLDPLVHGVERSLAAGHLASEPFGLQGYGESPELLRHAATAYAGMRFPDRSSVLPAPQVGRGPRIRIGYVAGEFRNQATSVLLTEVLELHDRDRFEIVAFDNGWSDDSELRKRIEAAVDVVPIRGLANLPVAQLVRERGIDVLVNLNGYFGLSRTHVFALRAAPVQVNYLGFPGTIGAPYVDYIIADRFVIPEAERQHYVEKVVYLPDSYQPNDRQRRVATEPQSRAQAGLPDDAFVFCCMNNVYKIMPSIFDIWMRLLKQVPGSVLLLYSESSVAQDNLRHEVQARGVDAARLLFGPPWKNENHLRRLQLCDLFLDTWPYNAHTTGTDALWAGLPVLTCTGRTFPSRVGASLLHAVGLPELVTDSFEAYEALALRLATEPGLLDSLRQRLADRLPSAALYDTPRYTRHLEAAYTTMVERARDGLAPEAFACADAG